MPRVNLKHLQRLMQGIRTKSEMADRSEIKKKKKKTRVRASFVARLRAFAMTQPKIPVTGEKSTATVQLETHLADIYHDR